MTDLRKVSAPVKCCHPCHFLCSLKQKMKQNSHWYELAQIVWAKRICSVWEWVNTEVVIRQQEVIYNSLHCCTWRTSELLCQQYHLIFLIWPVGSWCQEVAVCSPWDTHKCMFVKSDSSAHADLLGHGTFGLYKEGLASYARSVTSWNGWKKTWKMRMTQPVHQKQNSAIHYASAQNVGQHKRLEYSFCRKSN